MALELPPAPVLTVYADETGKTGKVLLVGSVWVPTPRETSVATRAVAQWKDAVGFAREFHFTEMRRDDLPYFIKFVELMLDMAPTVSAKHGTNSTARRTTQTREGRMASDERGGLRRDAAPVARRTPRTLRRRAAYRIPITTLTN